jgi:hydroxymethylpyrimidine pyrophosphatase-like HAD family hydrolase
MATICDIDDTLLKNGNKPMQNVIDYVNALPGAVILVTGRNNTDRAKTIKALKSAGVKYSKLIMNPGSTYKTANFKYRVGLRLVRCSVGIHAVNKKNTKK